MSGPARKLRAAPDPDQRIWRLIDPATGDFEDYAGCPECEEKEAALIQLERQHRATNARLTRLQRDQEKEARRHKLWAEAETVHDWWAIACGHPGVKFGAEDFYQALPRLGEGPVELLKGIAGAAYDPSTKQMKNGRIQRFDSWELITRSSAKLRSFADRAPGPQDSEDWKRWLVRRIESNLAGTSKGTSKGTKQRPKSKAATKGEKA